MAAAAMAGPREKEAALRQCAAQLRSGAEAGRRLQALLALRRKHLKEPGADERFRSAGGVRRLLGIVQRYNNNWRREAPAAAAPGPGPGPGPGGGPLLELELSLSILANCCTREGARSEVRRLGGIPPLVSILKTSHTVSVLNRTARALGNLALEPDNSVTIHQAGAVPALIALLSLTEERECLQTALRTLRILSDTPYHRRALTAQGLVPPLLALLSREEQEPAVLGAACRTAAELTRACSAPCALQLSRHGGIAHLASLAGHGLRAVREAALGALGNLCGQGFVRPSVGGAGGVGLLLGALRQEPSSPQARAHLRALCLCCREAVNRARVREEGGLDLLLSLLQEPEHQDSVPRVLLALLAYFYDQAAVDYLQARGLVSVLLGQLPRLAGLRCGAPPLPRDTRGAASFDYPPERPVPGEEQPTESSPSFVSLRAWLLTEGYIDSPDELLLPSAGAESDGALWLAAAGEREEAEGGLAADRPGESSPYLPETPALLLLSRFSQAEVPAPGLLTEQAVRVLLDYLTQAPAPSTRCARLLGRLVCNPNCLEELVRAQAVPLLRAQLIHGWRPPSPCLDGGREDEGGAQGPQRDWIPARANKELGEMLLRDLSVQAESPFGNGTVTHLLLSGSRSDREHCGVALPLLCRNEALRRKLLIDHGGLHLLTETLLSSEDPVATFGAADSLAWLLLGGSGGARGGSLPPPASPPPTPGLPCSSRCPYREPSAPAPDLRLLLDGGERLPALRARLRQGSEVFAAMLGGGVAGDGPPRFLEWGLSEVRVRGLEADVAELLLHHLHGCQAEAGCPVLAPCLLLAPLPSPGLEESLLGRSLAAAGQFLVSELCGRLEQAACRSLASLGPPLLARAFLFAEGHSLPALRAACLSQMLLLSPGQPAAVGPLWRRLGRETADRTVLLATLRGLVTERL